MITGVIVVSLCCFNVIGAFNHLWAIGSLRPGCLRILQGLALLAHHSDVLDERKSAESCRLTTYSCFHSLRSSCSFLDLTYLLVILRDPP